MKKNGILNTHAVALLGLLVATGCPSSSDVVSAGNSQVIVDTPSDILPSPSPSSVPSVTPSPTSAPAVCDPFTNDPGHVGSDMNHGIVANIKYLQPSDPRYTLSTDYQTHGTPIDATLFFTDINVPTRSFSLGFTDQNGNVIRSQSGDTLYEYFGVHFETQIQLTQADVLGNYQFAVISDDGSVIRADSGSGFTTLLNNDGTHPSRFTASQSPINFSSRTMTLPIQIDYYQGPRYHIAMVLMWRPWPQTGSAVDPMEGQSGNDLFFDSSSVPSVPSATYQALLTRGWKPISASNYTLPKSVSENPCSSQDPVTTTLTSISPSASSTVSTSITFAFSSNYASATFNCSLDGGASTPCVSPKTYSGLSVGTHQFAVYANANNLNDLTGSQYSWSVLSPGTTTIDGASPSALVTNSRSMSLIFSSNYSNATFNCQLDGAALVSCTSPWSYSSVVDGDHVFKVFSTVSGVTDTVGATYRWKVDTVAPTIQAGAAVTTTTSGFTVTWTTSEPATTVLNWGQGSATTTTYLDPQLTTSHTVSISGLSSATIYSYIMSSADQAGNLVNSVVNRVRTK